MGCAQRIGLIVKHVFACFITYTVTSSAMVPTVSETTCSQLVASCMRVWGEVRFQPDVGNKNLWSSDALNSITQLGHLMEKVKKGQHDGLHRENVEYVVHLVDRISVECDHASENSGSEFEVREFLARLASLWVQLRSVMLEV